LNSPNIWIFKH